MTTVALEPEPDTKRTKVESEIWHEEGDEEGCAYFDDKLYILPFAYYDGNIADDKSVVIEEAKAPTVDDEEIVIELNNYWPHGLEISYPENWSFIYFCKVKCDYKKYEVAERILARIDKSSKDDRIPWMVVPKNGHFYIYLNVDSIMDTPSKLTETHIQLLTEAYFHENIIKPDDFEFADTFDYAEAIISEDFKVKLRDYQLRSVSWMKSVEGIKDSEHNTVVFNADKCIKFKIEDFAFGSSQMFKERFYGGILADDTGSGKTITTLALIHSTKFTEENQKERIKRFPDCHKYHQSRASCIVCPQNIYEQWILEAKRCDPKLKIVAISSIPELESYSLKDFTEADMIIASYQLFCNPSYIHVCLWKKESLCLSRFHFHRVILDECHELESRRLKMIKKYVGNIRADYYWGLTGTPHTDDFPDQLQTLKFDERILSFYKDSSFVKREIERKAMKRNIPDLKLPELVEEIVWVEMHLNEKALCEIRGHCASIKEKIMLYTHYQLGGKGHVPSDGFLTVEKVKQKFYSNMKTEFADLNAALNKENDAIARKSLLNPGFDATAMIDKTRKIKEKLKKAQSTLNYFEIIFKAIENSEESECKICSGKIPNGNLTILPCSHFFCYDCLMTAMDRAKECPLCKKSVQSSDIFRVKLNSENADLSDEKYSRYSSKLIVIYKYINETIRSDPNAKIILFLQYGDLARFVAESFIKLDIDCVRVTGSILARQKAINDFKDLNGARVIILSSEDSVSGMNLTEATHILLVHPFFTNRGEDSDVAYEKQGISRAHRFGLKHPLKVVRFAVKGTVEEEITLRRINVRL